MKLLQYSKSVIPALGGLRQEDLWEFGASLSYRMRSYLKTINRIPNVDSEQGHLTSVGDNCFSAQCSPSAFWQIPSASLWQALLTVINFC